MNDKISRRKFLKTGTSAAVVVVVAGVGGFLAFQGAQPPVAPAPATPSPAPALVPGASADERAVNAARELVAALPPEERKVRVLLIAGAAPNWAPQWPKFEEAVGVTVEVDEVAFELTYEKALEDSIAKTGTWDVITTSQHWLGDYELMGVVHPSFQDWIEKYGPSYNETTYPIECAPMDGAIRSSATPSDRAKGRQSSFTVCSDSHTLFVQRALIMDPNEQEGFERQFGYPMPYVIGPEATWKQYRDMLSFFHRPDQGLNGGYLWRTRLFATNEIFMRFPQLGGVYFDENMNAGVNTRIFRQAAEEMKELNQYMDPLLLTRDLEIVYGDFPQGKGFAATAYASLASFTVREKGPDFLIAFRPPGYMVDGKLINNSVIWDMYGNFVNAFSKRAELAYLFLQFMHSPRIENAGKSVPGFFNDPWRECTFDDPTVASKFPTGSMPVIRAVFENTLPTLIFFGQREIDNVTAGELSNYFIDAKDIDTALNDMAEAWNANTESVGEEKQRVAWESFKQRSPREIKGLHGWT